MNVLVTDEQCERIIDKYPRALEFIKEPKKEICCKAIKNDPTLICFLKRGPIRDDILKENPYFLKYCGTFFHPEDDWIFDVYPSLARNVGFTDVKINEMLTKNIDLLPYLYRIPSPDFKNKFCKKNKI